MNRFTPILTILTIFALVTSPVRAGAAAEPLPTDEASVLEQSQVSYRAEGGFTGVESYGVIISCVRGEISVMASIHDPRMPQEPMRKISRMPKEQYLELWNRLIKQAGLKLADGPSIDRDVLDEFTVTFHLSVGEQAHRIRAQGLSLPECARYSALRTLIDDAVQMSTLWKTHDQQIGLLKDKDPQVTFETLNSSLD